MQLKNKIILLSILLGVLVGFIDAVIDYYFFYNGDFFGLLLLNVPEHEVYIRTIILIIFIGFGWSLSVTIPELQKVNQQNEKLINKLQDTLADMKKLSGLLPICASCKKIRDDQGYWNQLECYIEKHSEAAFTHGICPECAVRLYPEYEPNDSLPG